MQKKLFAFILAALVTLSLIGVHAQEQDFSAAVGAESFPVTVTMEKTVGTPGKDGPVDGNSTLEDEAEKYEEVVVLPADMPAGDISSFVERLKDGAQADGEVTIALEQKESKGYISCGNGCMLVQQNTGTGAVVEQLELVLTKGDASARKNVSIVLRPAKDGAFSLMEKIAMRLDAPAVADYEPVMAMGAYRLIQPETERDWIAAAKGAFLANVIGAIDATGTETEGGFTSSGALGKAILALRAMGINPETLTTADGRSINAYEKLAAMAESSVAGDWYMYDIPYALTAYAQEHSLDTAAEEALLVRAMLDKPDGWATGTFDPDLGGPVMFALAPYRAENSEVSTAIDAAVECLRAAQTEDGNIISPWPGSAPNANSTAMAISGLAACGVDPYSVIKGGVTLPDALLTFAGEDYFGFQDNSSFNLMATAQGSLALMAAAEETNIYLFDGAAREPGAAEDKAFTKVTFDADGGTAVEAVEYCYSDVGKALPVSEKKGYTFKGWRSESGTYDKVSIRFASEETLTAVWEDNGGSGGGSDGPDDIRVYFTLKGDTQHQEGEHKKYETWISKTSVTVRDGATVCDVLKQVLADKGFTCTGEEEGYVESITTPKGFTLSEYDNGPRSGWMYEVNGDEPQIPITEYKLEASDDVLFHYVDDYENPDNSNRDENDDDKKGSSGGGKRNPAMVVPVPDAENETKPENGGETVDFVDMKGHWAAESVGYVSENGLMNGVSEEEFAPEMTLTRAMLAAVLYRIEGEPAQAGGGSFIDVPGGAWFASSVRWAEAQGILKGVDGGLFLPEAALTREQLAAVLHRYAQYKGAALEDGGDVSAFCDAAEISGWAADDVRWAVANQLLSGRDDARLAPGGEVTRAEAATVLARYHRLITNQ